VNADIAGIKNGNLGTYFCYQRRMADGGRGIGSAEQRIDRLNLSRLARHFVRTADWNVISIFEIQRDSAIHRGCREKGLSRPKPRWGWDIMRPFTRDSSCLAILGFGAQSRREMCGSLRGHRIQVNGSTDVPFISRCSHKLRFRPEHARGTNYRN
jgi:hypothetical protein